MVPGAATPQGGGARKIGIVCGLARERAALGPGLLDNPRILVAVSGAHPDRAEAEARRLAGAGCRCLVSWGIAGGLERGLLPGALVVPDHVLTESGQRWGLSAPGTLAERIGAVRCDRLLGVERVVTGVHAKDALHAATGAAVVDMETHRVARAAESAGIPVLAVRAVSDPAGRALPASAADAVDPAGEPKIATVLLGLLGRPWDLPALLHAKRDSDRALAALAGAAPDLAATVLG